ncbi:MAG: hypothetical protein MZV70_60475 [Desulfobacterales bacterium]|nr:hypothetical protein [Desulfobacterales bacterium]
MLLVVLDFLLNFAQAMIMEIAGQRIMHDLRMRLYRPHPGPGAGVLHPQPGRAGW